LRPAVLLCATFVLSVSSVVESWAAFLTTELHREHKGCAEKILESLVELQNLFRNARPGDLPFHFARERIAFKRISARGTDEFK